MSTRQATGPSEAVPGGAVGKHRLHAVSEAGPSKFWQVATLILPIFLTAGLGFWVSQKEDSIKQDIDKQSQLFSQQLQLSDELYKRRFDAYDKLYVQLVQLNERLQAQGGAEPGQWNKMNADQFVQFNELLDVNKLHMGPKVEPLMFPAWMAAARGDTRLVSDSIHDLEAAMKMELDDVMRAPTAENTPSKPKKSKPQARSSQ